MVVVEEAEGSKKQKHYDSRVTSTRDMDRHYHRSSWYLSFRDLGN